MPTTIDDYRCKLINKILFAGSEEDVMRYADAAMKGLEQHKVNGHIISRFVTKLIGELEKYNPMDEEAQQWSNVRVAIIYFSHIKQKFDAEQLPKFQ